MQCDWVVQRSQEMESGTKKMYMMREVFIIASIIEDRILFFDTLKIEF